MLILVAGVVAAAILLLLPRFLGRSQERMLKQYLVLEKRFGLSRRVSQSRWGKGIGENCSLHGDSRGYPLSLYSHFVKKEKARRDWTSLVFEALFAENVYFCLEFSGTQSESRFEQNAFPQIFVERDGLAIWSSENLSKIWADEGVVRRMEFLSKQTSCGSIRLSKGFLEYREEGMMEEEEQRLRFQEAILLLASICDALSLYMSERRRALSQGG